MTGTVKIRVRLKPPVLGAPQLFMPAGKVGEGLVEGRVVRIEGDILCPGKANWSRAMMRVG